MSLKRTEMLDGETGGRSSRKIRIGNLHCDAGILSVSPCMRIEDVLRILCPFINIPFVDRS